MHPIKVAVCKEILSLLESYDVTERKNTVNSLRRPRYIFSRTEKAQIDYFIDKDEGFLHQLIDKLCQLITDFSAEVQKAALLTLTTFKKYPKVKNVVESKRKEIISSTNDLLLRDNLKAEVIIEAAKLLLAYKAKESKEALKEAWERHQGENLENHKMEKVVAKTLKYLNHL